MRLIDGEIVQSEISCYQAGAKSKEEKAAYMDVLVAVMDTTKFQKWAPTNYEWDLPKEKKEVLLADKDGNIYIGYYWKWLWWNNRGIVKQFKPGEIEYWMPIRELPKKVEEM